MSEHIRTPASQARRPTVAVLGAGVRMCSLMRPPVKLGGLAASQYSTVGTHDGSHAELRPLPGRPSRPGS
ncbi:hypothetical protein MAHJHV59_49900 [Mycobacterium avium subsp. hominissuis]